MLSSSVIKNVNSASHYYSQKDNYYTADEGLSQSEWWGKGANKFELTGKVDEKLFLDLLNGKLPNGEVLGKMVDGILKHRAGWDLTFSAPKSLSIMAYIGGDKRLIEAHRQAVMSALNYIERSCAQARIKSPDGIDYQNTVNLLAALFHHDLSREKDPQMHTHAVIMNMTERLDGVWRSLASSIGRYDEKAMGEINGFIERVRHFNRFLSKLYETELAYHVKQLGYEITTDTPSGIFEIADISQEVIQNFSKRRQQIKAELEEKGLSGGKAAAVATLTTRDVKESTDREKLKEHWELEAKLLGLDCQKIIERTDVKENINAIEHKSQTIDSQILDMLQKAAKSLSVFQTTFTLEEIVMEASSFAIREKINVQSILEDVDHQITKGELLSLHTTSGKMTLMAKSTLEEEKRLIAHLQNNQSLRPTVDSLHLSHFLTQHEEINSVHHSPLINVFNNDRVVLLEGEHTKKDLVDPIIKIARSAELNIAILSPSLVGSKKFAKEVKQQPTTLWEHLKAIFIDNTPRHYSILQFLSHFGENNNFSHHMPDVLLVDNAHLLSTYQKEKLIEWNKIHDTKLILFGNKDTLLPQQRGTSLDQLIEHIKPISLPIKENAIETTQAIHLGVAKVVDRIIEVPHKEDRISAMINHYIHLSENDRRNSWLVGQTKQSVEQLNLLTHDALVEHNKISKTNFFKVLVPVFLSQEKGALSSSYQKNQIVRFNETYSSLNIQRGEYLRILDTNEKSNRIVLEKVDGTHVVWQPERTAGKSGKIELFYEKEQGIGVGESILIHRSIQSKQVVKGERFTVIDVYKQQMKLQDKDGKRIVLDLTKPYHSHIDYAYAATPHMITHEKSACLIAELPTQSYLTNQRQFYQVISQPKEAWIYTDNSQNLMGHLEKKTGNRLSAIETLKKSEEMKKNLHTLHDILEKKIITKEGGRNINTIRKAVDAIDYAMRHLAEREAGFTHKDLMYIAMKYALGHVTEKSLTQVAIEMEKAGLLSRGINNDGTLWTTAEAVKIEREILGLVNRDKGQFQPIVTDEHLSKYCDSAVLRPEQIAAIKAITQSRDRVLSIQGRAGTGKTTMMMTLANVLATKDVIEKEGYVLQGIAPTNKAVRELHSRSINAQTIDSFLLDMRRIQDSKIQHDFSKTLLIIDEASMVSNRKMLEVLKVAHDFNFRAAISTGDTEQNPAIESGKPHALIQSKLENTILLQDIQRQKNPILKAAVQSIYQHDVKKTFSILKDSIIEINAKHASDSSDANLQPKELHQKYYQKRIEAIATDYVSGLIKGENVQIIAPSHRDRKGVNEEVRFQLNKLNVLRGEDHSFATLSAKDMTGVERSESFNFKAGQVLRFTAASGKLIKSGDYLTIKNINTKHNLITLMNSSGQEIIWQVPRNVERINNMVEVFDLEKRNLKVGDKITWLRTDKKEGILSTDHADVTQIEKGLITAKRQDGSIITFDGNEKKHQHWDHAYAITIYGSQGGTYSTILAIFESYREKLMNLKNFLVTITRPVNQLRIYTDNQEKLQDAISHNMGNKLSSLEVIGEYSITKQNKKQNKVIDVNKLINKNPSKNKQDSFSKFDKDSIERIKTGLNRDAEKIAIDILGQPKVRGSHFLKFGSNQGSLSITTKGERQGWWNDFSDNGGRSMLSFIQKYAGLSKDQAIEYGAKWLGIYPQVGDKRDPVKLNKIDQKIQGNLDKKWKLEQTKKIAFAKKLAEQSHPINGTLAEKYLREHRAITLETLPDDVRFHPGIYSKLNAKTLPAMLVIARDKLGQIQAVQATYLDKTTAQKIDKSIAVTQKQTFGLLQGTTVSIHREKGLPILIAEGTETGLSLANAIKQANIKITLGKANFKHLDSKSLSEKVIFCLDNDGKDIKADKLITESAKRLLENNKQVSFMLPTILKNNKQDYNDVLKQLGSDPIKNDFDRAIPYAELHSNVHHAIKNHIDIIQPTINTNAISIIKDMINVEKLPTISDKPVDHLPSEILKNNQFPQDKQQKIYQPIEYRMQQSEITKPIPKTKDFEQEI